jgi:hypothetical protein
VTGQLKRIDEHEKVRFIRGRGSGPSRQERSLVRVEVFHFKNGAICKDLPPIQMAAVDEQILGGLRKAVPFQKMAIIPTERALVLIVSCNTTTILRA